MTDTTAAPASAPEVAPAPAATGEEAELLALHANDPQVFEYSPTWKGTNKTAAARLVEIRKGQSTDAKTEAQQAEPVAADDITDSDDTDAAEADVVPGETAQEVEETGDPEAPEPGSQYDLEDYELVLPKGSELTEAGKEGVAEYAEYAHLNNMAPDAFQASFDFIRQKQAQLLEGDKTARAELVASLKREMGDGYAAFSREVDTAFRELPQELRTALKTARLPDGRLLASMPETMRLLQRLNNQQASHHEWRTDESKGRDRTTMLREELRQINEAMNADVSSLYKEWRGTGKLATDRRLEIARELAGTGPAKPGAADLRAEERELELLKTRDPEMFNFGDWKGSGRPAAERLARIQQGRI